MTVVGRWRSSLAVVVLAGGSLAACSDDGGTDGAAAPTGATSSPLATSGDDVASPPGRVVVAPTGDGPPPAELLDPPPPPPSACSLVTADEVSDAVGAEAAGNEGNTAPDGRELCVYLDAAGAPLVRVWFSSAELTDEAGGSLAEAMFAELAASAGAEPIATLGDRAVSTADRAALLTESGLFEVELRDGAAPADPRGAVVALLELAVA